MLWKTVVKEWGISAYAALRQIVLYALFGGIFLVALQMTPPQVFAWAWHNHPDWFFGDRTRLIILIVGLCLIAASLFWRRAWSALTRKELEIVWQHEMQFVRTHAGVDTETGARWYEVENYLALHNTTPDKTIKNVFLSVMENREQIGMQQSAKLQLAPWEDKDKTDMQPNDYRFFKFAAVRDIEGEKNSSKYLRLEGIADPGLLLKAEKAQVRVGAFADNAHSDKFFSIEARGGHPFIQPYTGTWDRKWNGDGIVVTLKFDPPI